MKIQTLTKKQEERLLELCREFFPEYQKPTFYHAISRANMLVFFLLDNDSDIYDNCDLFVHWYQLCLTELPKRIWSKLNSKGKYEEEGLYIKHTNIAFNTLFSVSNPVDFLYEFVQDCKKNKYFKKYGGMDKRVLYL